jgi:hypothetical protein
MTFLSQSHPHVDTASHYDPIRPIALQLLLIRLSCKFDEELTTDNILHYLGIIEERALEIISNYLRTRELSSGDRASCSSGGNIPSEKFTGGGVAIGGAAAPISVNAPRLLDYSSDESGDEGVNFSLKPLHRSDMNYTKIASILPKKKAIPGRRGSVFGLQPKRRSAAPDGMT